MEEKTCCASCLLMVSPKHSTDERETIMKDEGIVNSVPGFLRRLVVHLFEKLWTNQTK